MAEEESPKISPNALSDWRIAISLGLLGASALGVSILLAGYIIVGCAISFLSGIATAWLYFEDLQKIHEKYHNVEVIIGILVMLTDFTLPPYLILVHPKASGSAAPASSQPTAYPTENDLLVAIQDRNYTAVESYLKFGLKIRSNSNATLTQLGLFTLSGSYDQRIADLLSKYHDVDESKECRPIDLGGGFMPDNKGYQYYLTDIQYDTNVKEFVKSICGGRDTISRIELFTNKLRKHQESFKDTDDQRLVDIDGWNKAKAVLSN
jgi:hypothetical protein